MATALNLDGPTIRKMDDLVASGRFVSREAVVREGLRLLDDEGEDEPVDLDQLNPATRQAIEIGLADVAAGRVYDADEVFDELERRGLNRQ